MRIFDPAHSTRRWLKVGLTVTGFIAGALFGLVLTKIGKIVGGAPPATLRNYLWNAGVFGVMSGALSPAISWSMLRGAPLWRTIAEPLGWALAGAAASVVLSSGVLMLLLPPVGLVIGFVRLRQRYPERDELPLLAESSAVVAGIPIDQPEREKTQTLR